MKIKGVSFSSYKVKADIYKLEKLDLLSFLFTRILLNEKLDKNLSLIECLLNLDIKEDLFYLFNNIYYTFLDNHLIKSEEKEDIYSLKLKDLVLDNRFIKYFNDGYLPVFDSLINKEFCYDYVNDKISIMKDSYIESNVCVFEVENNINSIEKIVNDNVKLLFNEEGIVIIKDYLCDPYYFQIELKKENDCYLYKQNNKEEVYKALMNNSLFVNDTLLDGEFLSNNIYFKCLFSNLMMKDYCDYLFVFNKEKEGLIEDNIIYVNYDFNDVDFIDLVNKESYKCGYYFLENRSKISTFIKSKNKEISEFKLYLLKNKNKFKINIEEIVNLIQEVNLWIIIRF